MQLHFTLCLSTRDARGNQMVPGPHAAKCHARICPNLLYLVRHKNHVFDQDFRLEADRVTHRKMPTHEVRRGPGSIAPPSRHRHALRDLCQVPTKACSVLGFERYGIQRSTTVWQSVVRIGGMAFKRMAFDLSG